MFTSKGEKLSIGDIVVVDGLLKGEIVSEEGRRFTIRDDQSQLHVIEPWWIVSKWVKCECNHHHQGET